MKDNNKTVVDILVKASEVMTRQVVSVKPETTLIKVVDLMTEHKISGIPIIDDSNMIVGIVSEKDIFVYTSSMNVIPVIETSGWLSSDNANTSKIYQGLETIANTAVKDVMSSKVVYVERETPILEVAKIMGEKGINHVPVVNRKGELSGIIARQDITKFIKKGLENVSMLKKGLENVSMIMTKEVVGVEPEATLSEAIKLLAKNNISGMPVVTNNKELVGIVSERDIIQFTSSYGGIPPQASYIITAIKSSNWLPSQAENDFYFTPAEIMTSKKIKDVMSTKVVYVNDETTILEAAKIMETKGYNRIPVMNKKGELIGIITRQDLVNYLAKS